MKSFLLIVLSLASISGVSADERSATLLPSVVEGQTLNNELVVDPARSGRRPAIVLVPAFWGITSTERAYAAELAKLGYVVLIADIYGDGISTDDPRKASELVEKTEKDEKAVNARFDKALEILRARKDVNPKRIVAIGFGFGGGVVLDQARAGKPLAAFVSYYGGLRNANDLSPKPIQGEVIAFAGDNDVYIDKENREDFKFEMRTLKAKAKLVVLKDATHEFASPRASELGIKYQLPFVYDEKATTRAWNEVRALLNRVAPLSKT